MKQKTDEMSVEQQTFHQNLLCLKIIGFWLPSTLKRSYQKLLYRFFSIFAHSSVGIQIAFIIIHLIIEKKDFVDFLEMWFVVSVFLFTYSKGLNILMKRGLLYEHLCRSTLADRWTKFRDTDEKYIVDESKKGEVLIFKLWGGSVLLNGIFFILNPIISENPDNRLMWDCYSPCDVQMPKCYWTFYIYQVYTYATTSSLNVAYDCLIWAMILRLCAYVKIFQHRLILLPELVKIGELNTVKSEMDYLKQCINDHQNISVMANELYILFNITVMVHFFLSFSLMCTNVLTLSKLVLLSGDFFAILIHFCCVLLQNYLYSWYAYKFQEVTEEIPYTIFSMDWTGLNKNTIKLLRFIMLFASRPIPLFNNFIVDLSPEMFLQVVKLSYSTFNVMRASN